MSCDVNFFRNNDSQRHLQFKYEIKIVIPLKK